MATKITIRKRDKFLDQQTFQKLIEDFINDSSSGRRTKKNGTRISAGTIENYFHFKKLFDEYCEHSSFEVKIYLINNLTQTEKERANRYYKKFYKSFTSYLYDHKKYFDNYIGLQVKCLRIIFNYLEIDRNISVGTFHRSFFVPVEEIPIIALSSDQLNYIIFDEEFNTRVNGTELEKVKDIFVFGCTVALRVSDILQLTSKNLAIRGEKYYLNVKSQKTNTHTSIKLPGYAMEITKKYNRKQRTLLPSISVAYYNTKLKELGKLLPNDFEMIKTREKRGKQVVVYKDSKKKTHYKLSDHLTSHTMRRTAITTMLSLGMPEHLVRKISGHAANSKEFFRYVQLSQSFIDDETDKVFEKICNN